MPQDKGLSRLSLISLPKYCQLLRYFINLFSLQLIEIVTRLDLVLSTVPSGTSNPRQHNKQSFSFHFREPNIPGFCVRPSRTLVHSALALISISTHTLYLVFSTQKRGGIFYMLHSTNRSSSRPVSAYLMLGARSTELIHRY